MPVLPKYTLSTQAPSVTYSQLAQYAAESGSLTDGLGNVVDSLNVTASNALTTSIVIKTNIQTSSYADTASVSTGLQLFNPTTHTWYTVIISGSAGNEILILNTI